MKPYHPAPATIAAGFLAGVGLHAGPVSADSFTCDMSAYKEAAGLAAAADGQALALTWAGAGSDEGRMRSQELLDKYKCDAFWDAPLRIPGGEVAHGGATPPPGGIPGTNQPGLPRKPEEVRRAKFPPEFAEVVWGDGQKTGRQIIRLTDQPAFGSHHFEIPFDATGRKRVRFAVWDSAGNGAFVQPVKLSAPAGTGAEGR